MTIIYQNQFHAHSSCPKISMQNNFPSHSFGKLHNIDYNAIHNIQNAERNDIWWILMKITLFHTPQHDHQYWDKLNLRLYEAVFQRTDLISQMSLNLHVNIWLCLHANKFNTSTLSVPSLQFGTQFGTIWNTPGREYAVQPKRFRCLPSVLKKLN